MRPIVVTGAAGFAGRHLVQQLAAAGRPVEAWVHRTTAPMPAGVRVRHVDIRDGAACARALAAQPPAGLVHLAAVTSLSAAAADPALARAVNVGGTVNLLQALDPDTPAVFASTCHVYGTPGALPLRETDPLAPVGVYAETKAEAEAAALRAHPRTVIARAFHHTGPGQAPTFALAQWARDLERGVRPIRTGDLTLRRDYCDVRDVVRGYVHLLDAAAPGETVNLCSGRAPELGTLLALMAADTPLETQPNPAWFRDHDPREIRGDASRANALGWRPLIPMAETLRALRGTFAARPEGAPPA